MAGPSTGPISLEGGNWLAGIVGDNPYFSAGFGLMGVGVGYQVLRQGLQLANSATRRRLLVSLEIPIKDRSYEWFLAWMASQASKQVQRSTWTRSHQLSVETTFVQQRNGSSSALFTLVAGPGTHWFNYKGAWMHMKRERVIKQMNSESKSPWETLTLTTLSRDRYLFSDLLLEARDLALRGHEGKLVVHTAWGLEWKPFGQPRTKRDLSSVILDEGISERVEGDLKSFLNRRKWYAQRGIPYRRGYLLHGPPGSGKTSYIQALAGAFDYDICILNLSERGMGDDKLIHLLSNAPPRCFIVIEDIDAAFNKRVQTSEDGYKSSVTFSGFLNALDGVASGEERVVFLTTNHVERLDPALIRPGRVDLLELLDDSSPHQAERLFTQFYGSGSEVPPEHIHSLAAKVKQMVIDEAQHGRRVSMAALQGQFIRSGPETAVSDMPNLFVQRSTR